MNKVLLTLSMLLSIAWVTAAQQLTVTGKITDSSGDAFPGANVVIKGTTTGTVTDLDGNYSITVPSAESVLVYSFIGYLTEEVVVGPQSVINITLVESMEAIEELVVVGYGVQRRQDLTSAIATLNPNEVLKMPGGVTQAIQGQVAGVQVTDNRIRIRGTSTINNTDPLWVVDGFIGGQVPNENEIESIQILKDAAAAAIYGARGSNGVIIVTTKRGTAGPTKVEYHGYTGLQNPWQTIELLNGQQQAELANEATYNFSQQSPNLPVRYFAGYENPPAIGKGTDWQDAWFRQGYYHSHNLAVSGGNENSRFRVSANYNQDQSFIIRQNSDTYGTLITSEHKKGRITLGQTLNVSQEDRRQNNQYINDVWRMTPNIPIYDKDNLGGYAGPGADDGHDMWNSIGRANLIDDELTNVNIKANAWLNVEIIKGLNYRFNAGYDRWSQHTYYYEPQWEFGPKRIQDIERLEEQARRTERVLYENTLTYDKTFGRHSFTLMGGVTSEVSQYRSIQAAGESFPLENLRVLSAAEGGYSIGGTVDEWAMFSLLGRVNYNFASKYLLTANIRRDGSSKFDSEYRYGLFPSVSVAWRMAEEDFFKAAFPFVNEFKLRASWGSLGNDRVPSYGFESSLNMAQFYILNDERVMSYQPLTFASPGLKWETSKSIDIGFDLELLNRRLVFIADYFDKTTEDILIRVPIPLSSGIDGVENPPWVNAGSINNQGVEFAVTYRDNAGDFFYSFGANATSVKNTVLQLGELGEPILSGTVNPGSTPVTRTQEGGSIGDFYGFVTDGIYQNQAEIDAMNKPIYDDNGNVIGQTQFAGQAAPGDIRFKDLNGDGILNDDDKTFIGSPIPKISLGFHTDLSYRGFDFSMLWQGDFGHQIYNQGKYFTENMMHYSNNRATVLDRWRGEDLRFVHPATGVETFYPANTNTDMPRAVLNDPNSNIRRSSDRFIEDGTYLRLKRIMLGYTLPESISQRMYVDKLRIYIGSKNLLTFTNYSGYDPEVGDRGDTNAPMNLNRGIDVQNPWGAPAYPQAREFFTGIQVTF